MVSITSVVSSVVHQNVTNGRRNENVWIGVPISVRVCGEIVLEEEGIHLKELRDGLAMVTGDAGRKVLRRLNAAGGRLYGIARNRDRDARSAGIGGKQLVAHVPLRGRVGRERILLGLHCNGAADL